MDPLTIAKLGLNVIGAQVQKKKDQKFGDFMIQQAEKTPMYQMSDTYSKYLAMAKQDPVGDYMKEQAARNQGTSVAALKSGGAKSILGGLGAVQQQAYADQMNAVAKGQANLQQALQIYAGAEQDIMDKNVGQQKQKLQGILEGELYKKMAKDTARKAIFSAGEGLTGAGMNFLNGLQSENDETMVDAESGGRVPKTPGDFSHSSNPIDIVRKGKKIGEMTGGEYVLNPAQAAKMQSLASSKKKEALQRYVTGLFNKFNAK